MTDASPAIDQVRAEVVVVHRWTVLGPDLGLPFDASPEGPTCPDEDIWPWDRPWLLLEIDGFALASSTSVTRSEDRSKTL